MEKGSGRILSFFRIFRKEVEKMERRIVFVCIGIPVP
jgi:hypothetical protein